MRVTLDKHPLGQGEQLYHVTVYTDDLSGEHGTMHLVAADNLAKALYVAWVQEFDDTEFFDIKRCDGYLIGRIERHL